MIEALPPSALMITRVLPVVYAEAGRIICGVIETERPDAVLCLGLCARSSQILLERVALNINDDTCGDNAGDRATGRTIDPAGPVGYWSTLPLLAIHRGLREKGMPVGWSNHAGTYVCNHVFYTACRAVERLGGHRRCGFVHLPPLGDGGLSLSTLVDAVRICLAAIEVDAATK